MGVGDPAPVEVKGRRPGVLAIHGWSGTPQEVLPVVNVARELGLAALAPLLPGHGTHADDLAKTTFTDWSNAGRDALHRMATPDEPCVLAGLSLGSVVAMHLAITEPERVLSLILLANATFLTSPFPTLALAAVDRLHLPDFSIPKSESDIADPEARRTNLTYSAQPVHSAIEVLRAGERVRRGLHHIRCPVFIAHGALDRVCPAANAEWVARRVGSEDRTVLLLPRSRHIITRDYDRDVLRERLRRFIARVAGSPNP